MSGEDKRIRSSFTVTDVLGQLDTRVMIETLEKKCSAGTLNVDASSEWTRFKGSAQLQLRSIVLALNNY